MTVPKLSRYQAKRNFEKTAEPSGTARVKAAEYPRFVIQKHAASRLHYDLRLEVGGIFKSRAVTKGPSLDAEHQKMLDDLKSKSGKDFDQAYDRMQILAHEQAVALFEQYAHNGENPELKSWANMTLPHLK